MTKQKKRRTRGEGTIRQRKDGAWEARFVVGVDPGTGRDIRKSVYARTQKEVRQKMTEALAALDKNDYHEPCKMTVGAWLDIWAETYLGGVKPHTVRSYTDIIKNHLKPALNTIPLDALNAHTIQQFYNALGKEKDGKPGLSSKTVKNIHGVLHQALQQAVMLGYIRANPTDACILPRRVKKEIHPLDEEQSKAFLEAIKGHRFETLFTVTLFTGLREGEALGLLWNCLDLENGIMLVDKQLQLEKKRGGKYIFVPLKNDRSRTVALAPWVIEILKHHRAVQAEQRLRTGPLWENSGLVFTNELGRHLAIHTVYKDFKKIVASIGCPEVRFHDLRHSYAVAALRAGDDIKTVQGTLGHATAAFTLDVYGHVTDQMKRASANRMEQYITQVLGLKG